MTDLNAMWDALARYQQFADADGHGKTWAAMCKERTEDAAEAAGDAAWAAEADAAAAGDAAAWAAAAKWTTAAYWSDRAIERIEAAIKERELVSSVSGQAQTTDEPFDLNEARNKDLFSAASQAIRHGMLAAIDEIDAEIECVEMEYEHDARLKQLIVNALERAKNLVRDRMAHGIGGDV